MSFLKLTFLFLLSFSVMADVDIYNFEKNSSFYKAKQYAGSTYYLPSVLEHTHLNSSRMNSSLTIINHYNDHTQNAYDAIITDFILKDTTGAISELMAPSSEENFEHAVNKYSEEIKLGIINSVFLQKLFSSYANMTNAEFENYLASVGMINQQDTSVLEKVIYNKITDLPSNFSNKMNVFKSSFSEGMKTTLADFKDTFGESNTEYFDLFSERDNIELKIDKLEKAAKRSSTAWNELIINIKEKQLLLKNIKNSNSNIAQVGALQIVEDELAFLVKRSEIADIEYDHLKEQQNRIKVALVDNDEALKNTIKNNIDTHIKNKKNSLGEAFGILANGLNVGVSGYGVLSFFTKARTDAVALFRNIESKKAAIKALKDKVNQSSKTQVDIYLLSALNNAETVLNDGSLWQSYFTSLSSTSWINTAFNEGLPLLSNTNSVVEGVYDLVTKTSGKSFATRLGPIFNLATTAYAILNNNFESIGAKAMATNISFQRLAQLSNRDDYLINALTHALAVHSGSYLKQLYYYNESFTENDSTFMMYLNLGGGLTADFATGAATCGFAVPGALLCGATSSLIGSTKHVVDITGILLQNASLYLNTIPTFDEGYLLPVITKHRRSYMQNKRYVNPPALDVSKKIEFDFDVLQRSIVKEKITGPDSFPNEVIYFLSKNAIESSLLRGGKPIGIDNLSWGEYLKLFDVRVLEGDSYDDIWMDISFGKSSDDTSIYYDLNWDINFKGNSNKVQSIGPQLRKNIAPSTHTDLTPQDYGFPPSDMRLWIASPEGRSLQFIANKNFKRHGSYLKMDLDNSNFKENILYEYNFASLEEIKKVKSLLLVSPKKISLNIKELNTIDKAGIKLINNDSPWLIVVHDQYNLLFFYGENATDFHFTGLSTISNRLFGEKDDLNYPNELTPGTINIYSHSVNTDSEVNTETIDWLASWFNRAYGIDLIEELKIQAEIVEFQDENLSKSTLSISLSPETLFSSEANELTSPFGSEIRLSFDKYFLGKDDLVNADLSAQPITIKWAEANTDNPQQTFDVLATWDSTTSQLVFNSPTDNAFVLIGVEYPIDTGTKLVSFPKEIVTNIIKPKSRVAIAAGEDDYSIALSSDGSLLAWGYNGEGELGDGTLIDRNTPVQVIDSDGNPIKGVKEIAIGYSHSIALKSDGTLLSWGANYDGQLGDGTTIDRSTPVIVMDVSGSPVSDIIAVAAGEMHSVALKKDGTLLAWGYNGEGELGDGTTVGRHSPVVVVDDLGNPVVNIRAISAGVESTIALKTNGTLLAWGYNGDGQLGDGTDITRFTPVEVVNDLGQQITGIQAVGQGEDYTVALKADGTLLAWGYNGEGQLGDGTEITRFTPVPVVDNEGRLISEIKEISVGYDHSIALKIDGSLLTWGENNGQLADGTPPGSLVVYNNILTWVPDRGPLGEGVATRGDRLTPVVVVDKLGNRITHIQEISAGQGHSLALSDEGTVLSWGDNGWGQLGDGTTIDQATPVAVIDENGAPLNLYNSELNINISSAAIEAGGTSSFALKPDGTWLAWGDNFYGQLSIEANVPFSSPATVVGDVTGNPLLNVTKISAGYVHAIALKDDGSLLAWGDNRSGQLGNSSTVESRVPVQVLDSQNNMVTGIKDIIAIDEASLAIKENGSLLTWGMDIYGTPGPDTLFTSTPKLLVDGNGQAITGIDNVLPIRSEHGFVIYYVLKSGTLFTLEPNVVYTETGGYEQRGSHLIPVSIESSTDFNGIPNGAPITGVKSVSSIFRTSYGDELIILKNDGSLLKREAYQRLFVPVVDGLGLPVTDVQSITTGYASCVILKNNGQLLALGQNSSGQLGDNTTIYRNVAINVLDRSGQALNDILDVSSKYGHSIALKSDGAILTWGANHWGSLSIYPVNDEVVKAATAVTVELIDQNTGYPSYTPLKLAGSESVQKLSIGFISEFPKDYTINKEVFVKSWTFSQNISLFTVNILNSTYSQVGAVLVSGNQVSIELTPDSYNPVNRIDLQLTDTNGNIVTVDNSDTFWAITKTNHAPQLVNGQVTQMMGGIEDTLALSFETYDIDGDTVTLSVVDADGGNVSFTGNRLYALFGDNQTIHNIQIALDDGKESVTVDIPVLRYDQNTVKTIYSDVSVNHPYAKDIAFATLNGAVWGQADLANTQQRLFKPDNNASWAEALKMVVKTASIANRIDLPSSEYYLQTYPQWAMPYYTFAREQGAINFKKDDLSITYPTREEIAMLLVRTLGLDAKLEDFPQLPLEFTDSALFSDALMGRYGQIARFYGLFMTNDVANPQAKVTRGELAQVISKIFMMPSAAIFSIDGVEYGSSFDIEPLINVEANIINDAFQLVDSSADLTVEYAINFQKLTNLTVDSSTLNIGSNTVIALIDNHGVRDFITKQIDVSFTDNDFDGVQDTADVWADDYRYQLDANQNQIPDILDSFYVLSGKTLEDSVSMGHLTIPITELISSGGFVCPQDAVVAYNPNTGEFQEFTGLCDVPAAWVVFPGIPTISPASGTLNSRVAVTLNSVESTTVYYTVDGSEPDTSSFVYSTPLLIENSAIVKMLVISAGGEASPVISESYTVLNKNVWSPIPGLSWQYQLQDAVDQSVFARVYDVDLIDTPKETIATLQANGSRVICYFNAGAWENWRSDAADYPEFIKGNAVDGYVDEQWLDIRELDTLSSLMQTRFDLAVNKGCDAVEPNNVDGYSKNTGFLLTANDQLNYNLWLSNQANARGLSIGLKNNLAQIPTLEPFFDWALNEQCLEFNECDALQPFVTANKAVFGVEYLTETNIPDTTSVCAITEANQYSWVIKRPELDSWIDSCADYRPFIDEDNDGVIDNEDNCLGADNLSQRDTDNDGFGNRCDADLNNDGITNFSDLAKFRQNFNTADPDVDLNGDGIVNFADLAVFRSLFNEQPGPSAGH